ncbi:MAG: ATP-binding protein, partial [Candidatus Rokuibacteriota bacterium]
AATAPAALRWERRRVTLLRAALAPRADADTPLDTNRPLEAMLDKIRTFGGTIDGMSPTGVLATFGLDAVEDAPGRAVLAAMAMQKAVARLVEGAPAPPALRVGIHVGQFLVGHGAHDAQLDEDAKQAALTALELMLVDVEPGSVVVGEGAMPFVGRRFELLELPARAGADPRVWMLGAPERAEAAAGRRTLFVGRRRELELLWSRLDSATRGQGQIVGIAGDAGIGKSRLVGELRQGLAGRGGGYLEGRCQTYGAAIPYLPVLALVRAELGVTEIDTPDAVAAKVRAGLVPLDREGADAAPLVLHLLGAADGDEVLDPIEPAITKARLTAALRGLMLRRSRREPLVIVIEDLHWIDTASDELLSSLAEIVTGARILLVCTYRPGYRPAWIDRSYATQVALSPLEPDESLSIVRAVLGGESLDDSLVERILAKGEGNPLFLEELARAVREAGGSPAPAVPDTVEEVLLARIDRLADGDKRLLQTAAVIGKDVPTPLLRGVAALSDDTLRAALARLRGAEFLYEVVPGPDGEHTFKHALTQEVAYASLLPAERVALHARCVDALGRLDAAARADDSERLAHHAFHGQMWERAVACCREAGARATARSANREAVARLGQALEALGRLPDSRENLELAIDIRLDLRTALLPLGEFARILEHLRQAETLATSLGDQRRLGQICAYLTNHFFVTGNHDRALENGQRADAIATALGDFALRLETDLRLGQVYHALGQYRRAAAVLERTVASLEGEQLYERFGLPLVFSVGCLSWLIRSLTELGAFAEGARHGETAVRIAETARHPFTLTVAYWSLGHLYLRQGDLPPAIAMLDKGLGLSRTWSIAVWVPRLSSALGSALALSGRLGEALPLLEDAVAQSNALRTGDHAVSLMALGEGYEIAGRHADAARAARESLAIARERGERGHEAWAQRLLGEITAGDPRATETGFRDALALAEELGMRPLAAHCRLGLTRAARALGRTDDADAQLTAAAAIYRELDMPLWRSRAAAERSASV